MVKQQKLKKNESNWGCQLAPKNLDYYLGLLPDEDAEDLLIKQGDFLLRKCLFSQYTETKLTLTLSVRNRGSIENFIINQQDGSFYFEKQARKSVVDLIDWHISTKTPISSGSSARIRNSVMPPAWLLDRKSITLTKNIGIGDYGQVFIAEYQVDGKTKEVTVEMLDDLDECVNFLDEARFLRELKHTNGFRVVGVTLHENSLMMVTDYDGYGDSVEEYLSKKRRAFQLTYRPQYTVVSKMLNRIDRLRFNVIQMLRKAIMFSKLSLWDFLLSLSVLFGFMLLAHVFLMDPQIV